MEEYTEAQRLTFCKAVANLLASDHQVTEEEREQLMTLLMSAGLSPLDERVEREVLGELDKPGPMREIVSSLQDEALSKHLFRVLVEVAAADGKITDDERKKVRAAAGEFGLDTDAACELLDWTVTSIAHEQKEQEILSRLGL